MKFNVVTIFPELIQEYLNHGLISKAEKENVIQIDIFNPRDFSEDKNGRIDDKPYGGGSGMLFKARPIIDTISKIKEKNKTHVIFLAPHGELFDQKKSLELKDKGNLTFLCGRYEGIDKRVEDTCVDEVISIGDYILNGGELPALVVMETIARLQDGFIGNHDSLNDSFSNGLLEHPQYTKPEKSIYGNVPNILTSGNHQNIKRWNLKESLRRTLILRPELLNGKDLSNLEKELLEEIKNE